MPIREPSYLVKHQKSFSADILLIRTARRQLFQITIGQVIPGAEPWGVISFDSDEELPAVSRRPSAVVIQPAPEAVRLTSVAPDESFTDKNGQKQERVEWHSIVAFSRLGEICAEHLKKGRQVFVEGSLRSREVDPKNRDSKRKRTEIVASRVQFLGDAPPTEKAVDLVADEAPPPDSDVPFRVLIDRSCL